jgi:hypothetical protein
MSTLKVTTALSKFKDKAGAPLTTLTFDSGAKKYTNKVDPIEFARYEGYLQQNAFMARLAYTPCEYFCRAVKFIDYSPAFGNNALAILRQQFNQRVTVKTGSCALTYFSYDTLYDSKKIHDDQEYLRCFKPFNYGDQSKKKSIGYFHQAHPRMLNVYLYVHHDPTSKINPEKTLFVAFKGTSTLEELLVTDVLKTVVPQKMANLTTPNNAELGGAYAHAGFVQALGKDVNIIHDKMLKLLKEHPDTSKIAITGHSLGGALAILYTLALANDIARQKIPIEIRNMAGRISLVTFGAPNIFPKTLPGKPPSVGAVLFNRYLRLAKIFTFDYVNSKTALPTITDIVPPIPPAFMTPGEKVGLAEVFSYSRKGRAQWVGNLRKGFGISQGGTRRRHKKTTTCPHRRTMKGGGLFNKAKSLAKGTLMKFTSPGKNYYPLYDAMLKLYKPDDPFAKDMSSQRAALLSFNGTSSEDRNKIRDLVLFDKQVLGIKEDPAFGQAENASKKDAEQRIKNAIPPNVTAKAAEAAAKGASAEAADAANQSDDTEKKMEEIVEKSAEGASDIADPVALPTPEPTIEYGPGNVAGSADSIYLPNRVVYSCAKGMTASPPPLFAFCHASYFYSFIRAFSNPVTVIKTKNDYTLFNAPGSQGPWSELATSLP